MAVETGLRFAGNWYPVSDVEKLEELFQQVIQAADPLSGGPKGAALWLTAADGTELRLIYSPGVPVVFVFPESN